MADKEAIRPIYSELQGCLAQAPDCEYTYTIRQSEIWNQCNTAIQELMDVTGKEYTRFKIVPKHHPEYGPGVGPDVTVGVYRQKLGSIIGRLHAEYFSDEPAPFAGMPSTIISQNQNQSVHVEFLLEVNDLIHEKLNKVKEGSKEKTFLEKIRGGLSAVKNVSQLVSLIMTTAKAVGIPIEQLASLFS